MSFIVMAYIVMVYIITVYIVMACLYSYGLADHDPVNTPDPDSMTLGLQPAARDLCGLCAPMADGP